MKTIDSPKGDDKFREKKDVPYGTSFKLSTKCRQLENQK